MKKKVIKDRVHLYFHSPCFDGTVSAVLASIYLKQVKRYSEVLLHCVNYHLKDRWLATDLEHPCAVVDFLYHTAADFWVDHHPTTFLNDEIRCHYESRRGPNIFYDSQAASCAILIWRTWGTMFPEQFTNYEELVQWADRIDSARYDSVEEVISLKASPLQINLALAVSQKETFSKNLVHLLCKHSLKKVATMPKVQTEFEKGWTLHQQGLRRLKAALSLTEDKIAVFDVNGDDVLINRYAPFYFYPQARYSAGIVRTGNKAKLTAMRNPWLEFSCAPLGQLCVPLGGGGHQRVGSIIIKDQNPQMVLSKLLESIIAWEHKQSMEVAL